MQSSWRYYKCRDSLTYLLTALSSYAESYRHSQDFRCGGEEVHFIVASNGHDLLRPPPLPFPNLAPFSPSAGALTTYPLKSSPKIEFFSHPGGTLTTYLAPKLSPQKSELSLRRCTCTFWLRLCAKLMTMMTTTYSSMRGVEYGMYLTGNVWRRSLRGIQ